MKWNGYEMKWNEYEMVLWKGINEWECRVRMKSILEIKYTSSWVTIYYKY